MTEIRNYGDLFPIDESICKDCAYRMTRLVVPLSMEDFGISEEDLKEMNLSDDEEVFMEQHSCLIIQEDMDYLVKACSQFKSKNDLSIFKNNPYM